jgi:hypothetical protein
MTRLWDVLCRAGDARLGGDGKPRRDAIRWHPTEQGLNVFGALPMQVIEYGTRLRVTSGRMRMAGMMKSQKVLPL